MHKIEKRYLKVLQHHAFCGQVHTLCWRALSEYAPRKGEIFNILCLNGYVEYVANTVGNEGLTIDFGNEAPLELVPSGLVMETTVKLEFGYNHSFQVEEIFEFLPEARHLTEITGIELSGNSWSSISGWRK